MKPITNWVRKQKTKVLNSLVVGLLLLLNILVMDQASAQTAQNTANTASEIQVDPNTVKAQETEQLAKESANAFQRLIDKTRASFETILTEANQTISDLPQQLEQAATETSPSIRKQIKNAIEDKQDSLENAADAVDDLSEKLQKYSNRLQRSAQESQIAISNELQNNIQNTQQSLKKAAQALDTLADNTERAKKSTTPAFRTQIGQEIQAVNQALDEVTKSIKVFDQNPA